ncbi:MAG TPA: hypothetical protein VFL83_02720 [Anaeromyxobacter sp.]|nr:hypothetical protein [Anaeromyxobacter sp.]
MTSLRAAPARATALAALLASAACAGAGAGARPAAPKVAEYHAFEVPGRGALVIEIPPGWRVGFEPGEPPAPRTIRLTGPGGEFVALLSPFWNPGEPEGGAARADTAHLFADLARRGALEGSVEREIALEELVGEDAHGFWFAATDRELVARQPEEGEWRHLLQGAAAVGPLIVAFTLLDNASGPQRGQLIALVRGARHVAAGGHGGGGEEGEGDGETADGPEEDPEVATVPLSVRVRGRSWTVLVDLPGFRMFRPREADEGVPALVVGHAPERGMVASVVIRPAEGARDAGSCRDADLARVRAAHPALADLRLSASGDAARALYVMPELGGKPVAQLHGHAWLYRDDVCANVHVSRAGPERDEATAIDEILATVRFGADL